MATSHLRSPDTEVFSTPPSTPGFPTEHIHPSLSRRSIRPTSLHINRTQWTSDLLVEGGSPNVQFTRNPTSDIAQYHAATPQLYPPTLPPTSPLTAPRSVRDHRKAMESPCFVHSHLDKGASLTDWLYSRYNGQHEKTGDPDFAVAKSLQHTNAAIPHQTPVSNAPLSTPITSLVEHDMEDEDAFTESLTKQLAETAVGVREMSKQLGQSLRLLSQA